MTVTTLQQITDAWGQSVAGPKDRPAWTASTDFSGHNELTGQTPCSVVAGPVVYAPGSTAVPGKVYMFQQTFTNNSNVADVQHYAHTDTYTNEFSWQLTSSLSLGVAVSAEAGVPTVGTVTESVTMEINLGVSTTSTTQDAHQWSVDSEVNVPAQSQIVASVEIDTGTLTTTFTAPVTIKGHAVMRLQSNRHHTIKLISFPIDEVLSIVASLGTLDLTGYAQGETGSIIATSSGNFTATEAVNVSIQVDQFPPTGPVSGTPTKTTTLPALQKTAATA